MRQVTPSLLPKQWKDDTTKSFRRIQRTIEREAYPIFRKNFGVSRSQNIATGYSRVKNFIFTRDNILRSPRMTNLSVLIVCLIKDIVKDIYVDNVFMLMIGKST